MRPPLPDSGAVIGLVGSGVGVQLCVDLTPSQVRPKPANPFAPCLPHRYGVPRELGAVLIPPTPNENGAKLRVIIPRVHADRTVAQFRVQAAAVVWVGPRCRGLGWGQVGIGVLVLARFRSARAHTHKPYTHMMTPHRCQRTRCWSASGATQISST